MRRTSNSQHANRYIHLSKQVFEGLVTYSKVKRINRGYVTHYTIKLTFRDQDYSNTYSLTSYKNMEKMS